MPPIEIQQASDFRHTIFILRAAARLPIGPA